MATIDDYMHPDSGIGPRTKYKGTEVVEVTTKTTEAANSLEKRTGTCRMKLSGRSWVNPIC